MSRDRKSTAGCTHGTMRMPRVQAFRLHHRGENGWTTRIWWGFRALGASAESAEPQSHQVGELGAKTSLLPKSIKHKKPLSEDFVNTNTAWYALKTSEKIFDQWCGVRKTFTCRQIGCTLLKHSPLLTHPLINLMVLAVVSQIWKWNSKSTSFYAPKHSDSGLIMLAPRDNAKSIAFADWFCI